jgi:hypothetical protein
LFDNIDFITLQGRAAVEDVGGGVFFEVSQGNGVSEDQSLVALAYYLFVTVRVGGGASSEAVGDLRGVSTVWRQRTGCVS